MESKLIVIGGSAGSLEALKEIVRSLPISINASIFVITHSMAREKSWLPHILNSLGGIPAKQAEEGVRIETGVIYTAPSDRHVLIAEGHVHLSRGPKEGLHRPSINVTFRSAAKTYGEQVIGVLLSGMLDDGAAGIWEIGNSGGTTIVQDPDDATYDSMPRNALSDAPVDYRLRSDQIGSLLIRLVDELEVPSRPRPEEDHTRRFSGFTCPECRGPLYETRRPGPVQFECRTGHIISLKTLITEETSAQERKLYEAIVALSEGADLAEFAASHMKDADTDAFRREAKQLRDHAASIRKMIEDRLGPDVD